MQASGWLNQIKLTGILTCIDVDECRDSWVASSSDNLGCHSNAKCHNFNGGFSCVCDPGFTGDGFNCEGMNSTF